ncbi:MAG: 16S rRNA (guanine(527)-N(7))-methyltransferase RsmG [Pseudomonadota bacterium]
MNKKPNPSIHYLDSLLKEEKISLNQRQLEQLWRFHKLLRENNKDSDLTRLFKFETIVTKHYIDCIAVTKLFKIKGPLLDIGTGAGFPGIPIKIAEPELDVTLAEHRPRRVDFLELVIKTLGLKDIDTYPHKIIKNSDIRKFNSVITRALETIPETLSRVQNIVNTGGKVIFMKGPNCAQDIREAESASLIFKLEKDISYSVSKLDKRRLVVFTRL